MDKLKIIFLNILIVLGLISLTDILFMNSGLFGTTQEYISGNYTFGLWPLFFTIALGIMISFSFLYWLYKNDISEAISIGVGSFIIWKFGASDILFFWLNGKDIPSVLPWLNNNFPINLFGPVTHLTLILSVLVGGLITYFTVKTLKDKF